MRDIQKRILSSCFKRKTFAALICSVLIFAICSGTQFSALAYNSNYLDVENWNKNDKVQEFSIEKSSPQGELKGTFSYIVDEFQYAIYMKFVVSESTLVYQDSIVTVDLELANGKQFYNLSVDENGLCNPDEEIIRNFVAGSNFKTYNNKKSGVYIIAIDINDGSETNLMNIYMTVNGSRYSVFREFRVDKPTTTKKSKSKSTKRSTKKSSTQKASTKATSKKSAKTTGFTGIYTGNSSQETETSKVTTKADTQEEYVYSDSSEHMTPHAIAMLIAGIVLAIISVGIIVYAVLAKQKNKEDENNTKSDSPIEDEDDFDF